MYKMSILGINQPITDHVHMENISSGQGISPPSCGTLIPSNTVRFLPSFYLGVDNMFEILEFENHFDFGNIVSLTPHFQKTLTF